LIEAEYLLNFLRLLPGNDLAVLQFLGLSALFDVAVCALLPLSDTPFCAFDVLQVFPDPPSVRF
jgi:hypothetical protein